MRYLWSHIFKILETYNGQTPLTHFFRKYFSGHPKLGSRDRKWISSVIYSWYRAGKGFGQDSITEELLRASLLITATAGNSVVRLLPETWQDAVTSGLSEKKLFLSGQGIKFNEEKLAAADYHLSDGISEKEWLGSMLSQPDLFLRIRKNRENTESTLKRLDIEYRWISEACLCLPNGTKVEEILPPGDYVVQDRSSQQTAEFFRPEEGESWWDCCSGAGGKSLLLYDLLPAIRLTASDKRPVIIENLLARFQRYKLRPPETFIADATDKDQLAHHLKEKQFDAIICDAPCTGSGTWARTPEQFYFFDQARIAGYAAEQKKILAHILPYVKSGGKIIYITCSVFREENEEVIADALNNSNMAPGDQRIINGIGAHADSMFVAVLKKN